MPKPIPDIIFICPDCNKAFLTGEFETTFDFVAKEMIVVVTCPDCESEFGMTFKAETQQ